MNTTNNKETISKNDQSQKDSSSDEQNDTPSASYYELQKILLDIDEKPDIIIEKILINIFNKYISPEVNDKEYDDLENSKKKIKILCLKHEKFQIVYYLLIKIRSLIKKYKEKLYELPNIIELQEKLFEKYYSRSYSHNKKISEEYINFALDRPGINHVSPPKRRKMFDYYSIVKNLFYELKNIKNCLEKTAPIIEKIFEIPLSEFEKFSLYECEKEDYLKILIHDSFIWNEIIKSRKSDLKVIIDEITEDENMNLTEMTNKIEYFKSLKECKKINIDEMLKISKIGSSIDSRYPEDAKPIVEIKYRKKENFDNFTTEINTINNFPSNEEIDIDEYASTNINSNSISNTEDITQHKIININNISDDPTIFSKIKESIIVHNKSKEIKKPIFTINKGNNITNGNNIHKINIKEDNKYIGMQNILKNYDNINKKDNIEKAISFNNAKNINISNEINNIIDKNISNNNYEKLKQNKIKLLKNKEKFLKSKKDNKKETNESNKYIKNNKKIDKKEIPSDIDDLVKYIVNDDKPTNKKKKKNRKKNKKNKNEKDDKEMDSTNQENKGEYEENNEIQEIKNNLIENSINRFKIHKIKFKYGPKWLEKISNYP